MSNFGAHTFNTGVYGGFGIALFSERISIARELLNHTNQAIRSWAEGHLESSQRQLEDATRRQNLHDARIDAED